MNCVNILYILTCTLYEHNDISWQQVSLNEWMLNVVGTILLLFPLVPSTSTPCTVHFVHFFLSVWVVVLSCCRAVVLSWICNHLLCNYMTSYAMHEMDGWIQWMNSGWRWCMVQTCRQRTTMCLWCCVVYIVVKYSSTRSEWVYLRSWCLLAALPSLHGVLMSSSRDGRSMNKECGSWTFLLRPPSVNRWWWWMDGPVDGLEMAWSPHDWTVHFTY